ncbi:TPA: DUF551 domain-containing protein [Klebsiella pneumoniae]|nr:DUF551 domain-containing protein [Klebsiella pneumoniae]
MTKSTITREQLLEIIETDHVQCGEASYLACIALAAMESEPVIIVGDDGGDALAYRRLIQSFAPGTKLYRHAQPSRVSMKDHQIRELVNELRDIAIEHHGTQQLRERIARTVRAAMFEASTQSPGSEPATVPGKWIPVSEQMPEDRTQVILWDAEIGEVTSGHYSHKTHTFYHCGDAIENEITHWMPTPAAPQEMKGE